MLLEKPGEVLTREEMRQRLWPSDTFVDFDHGLNSGIKKLRAALNDSAENSRYIETIPRVGYRFIAPVQELPRAAVPPPPQIELPSKPQPNPTPAAIPKRPWLYALAAIPLLLVAFLSYFFWLRPHRAPRPIVTTRVIVAVLPFENLTGDANQEYFSAGLTEEMIAQLSRLSPHEMGVISLRSPTRQSPGDLDQLATQFGVAYVLSGSVRRDSNQVRIVANLVQTKDRTHLFAREYDRELTSVLSVQGEIAGEVADEIQLALGGKPKRAVTSPSNQANLSPKAYQAHDLYLKGRYSLNQRTASAFRQAADYFQQAIATDPDYAPAYAGLADTFALISSWHIGPQKEFTPRARTAALKALQLDETLAEAHASLALIAENYDYDWQTAEKEYQRAIQLNPSYPTAHQWYAECLTWQGRFDEALRESETARQLDPLSLIIATDHAAILFYSRQYDRAIEEFRAVEKMDPSFPHAHLVITAYVETGRYTEALADLERAPGGYQPWEWGMKAYIYSRSGRQHEAERALAKMKKLAPDLDPDTQILSMYARSGRDDEAIRILQKYYEEHSNAVIQMKVDPALDPLRDDPRFQDLLHRVGLDTPVAK
jgi:TolB-like protein/Tfp pilus assembly protein PilF